VCPECRSSQVAIGEYDFGTCPQTGYQDAGEGFHCRACGATGDADDLVDARSLPAKSALVIVKEHGRCEA
jgi:methionyl-tRNA synthetase